MNPQSTQGTKHTLDHTGKLTMKQRLHAPLPPSLTLQCEKSISYSIGLNCRP